MCAGTPISCKIFVISDSKSNSLTTGRWFVYKLLIGFETSVVSKRTLISRIIFTILLISNGFIIKYEAPNSAARIIIFSWLNAVNIIIWRGRLYKVGLSFNSSNTLTPSKSGITTSNNKISMSRCLKTDKTSFPFPATSTTSISSCNEMYSDNTVISSLLSSANKTFNLLIFWPPNFSGYISIKLHFLTFFNNYFIFFVRL